jgi:TRAP-type C4-dicarboxylate transport system permease small subunit
MHMAKDHATGRSAVGRVYDFLEGGVTFYILGAIIVFICVFITVEIVTRFIFNYSFMGLIDIVEQGVVLVTYLSLGLTQKQRGHIYVDLLPSRLSGRRSGFILDVFMLTLGILITAVLLGESIWYFFRAYRGGGTTMTIFLPKWPFVLAMPIGLLFYLLRQVLQFADSLSSAIRFTPSPIGESAERNA